MRFIINMPEKDRATDIRNKHKKFGKDRLRIAHVVPDISLRTDRHTDRHTHHNTSPLLPRAKQLAVLACEVGRRYAEVATHGIWVICTAGLGGIVADVKAKEIATRLVSTCHSCGRTTRSTDHLVMQQLENTGAGRGIATGAVYRYIPSQN